MSEEIENEKNREYFYNLEKEIWERQRENNSKLDEALLKFSPIFMVFSLTVFRFFIPYENSSSAWLIPTSWWLFFISVATGLCCYKVGNKELDLFHKEKEIEFTEESTPRNQKELHGYQKKYVFWKTLHKHLQRANLVFFILATGATVLFINLNLKKTIDIIPL